MTGPVPAKIEAADVLRTALQSALRGVIPNAIAVAVASAAMIGANHLFGELTGYADESSVVWRLAAQPYRLAISTSVFAASIATALRTQPDASDQPRKTIARALLGFVTGLRYHVSLFIGFVCFVVPGVFVIASRLLAAPVAFAEGLGPRAAWERSEELSRGRFSLVVVLGLAAMALRGAINMGWPDTGALSARLGGGSVWYALAFVHQCAAHAVFVVDGSIAAALYVHLRDASRPLDAAGVAKVFD